MHSLSVEKLSIILDSINEGVFTVDKERQIYDEKNY